MTAEKAAHSAAVDLENLLRQKMASIFKRYGRDLDNLLTPLKWTPLVLIIGNYSSGKSTFINEILGRPVQRTGQAPTDDSFTIITLPEGEGGERELPGASVINDQRLPFASLRQFGESLAAHLRMKMVDSPALEHLTIIDTPGMLDSVTEKDRGYDYLGVVGELAKLADLIILMFDPHKAGTIKETYQAIRSTLPGATGEDRVLYVLNRIDECESITDLVRSYGTLCWNLSQMTGRKDMPRIFLTFADPGASTTQLLDNPPLAAEAWSSEREELKKAVQTAPRMRLNHIFQDVERSIRETTLLVEALASYGNHAKARLRNVSRYGFTAAVLFFCFGDLLLNLLTGYPPSTMLGALFQGTLTSGHVVVPGAAALMVLTLASVYAKKFLLPRLVRATLRDPQGLVELDTANRRDLWRRVGDRVHDLIEAQPARQVWTPHGRYLKRLEQFREQDLRKLYERYHPR